MVAGSGEALVPWWGRRSLKQAEMHERICDDGAGPRPQTDPGMGTRDMRKRSRERRVGCLDIRGI